MGSNDTLSQDLYATTMAVKFSLRARWVLTMDGPPIERGIVTIADQCIESVSPQNSCADDLQDLGNVVLMPGLVNTHTHLEFSDQQIPLGKPGMQMTDWIRQVIAARNRRGRDSAAAIHRGLQESLAAGVTTLGEIATASASDYPLNGLPQLIAFQEVIGFSSARQASVLADLSNRLLNGPTDRMVGISPHAPYTVHPQLLSQLVEQAVVKQLPVAMHLAESRDELQLLASNDGPLRDLLQQRSMWDAESLAHSTRPLDYLKILARAPRVLVVHGNYLEPDEIRFLAEQKDHMAVVYCPRTHAFFGHIRYPLPEMLAAGVRVALGTDSRASNPDLGLLGEMRFLFKNFPELDSTQILSLGTLSGAAALGVAHDVGSITPGKIANLTAVACHADVANPAKAVLQSEQSPGSTWLRGKLVELPCN